MAKRKYYMVLDTETATLPFANEIAKTPKEKQAIAIAKPLIYDIGWVIIDRKGNPIKAENYLVDEIWNYPDVFNTAYYRDKRPIYEGMIARKEIEVKSWWDIVRLFKDDIAWCDMATAFNACFDFKRAFPFTSRWMDNSQCPWFNQWLKLQYDSCKAIVAGTADAKNPEYLTPTVDFYGTEFKISDLRHLACRDLINHGKYKNFCLKYAMLTDSSIYFKTTAESTYRYLSRNSDFIESHTALDDAWIESLILQKLLRKGKVKPELAAFPERLLGFTYDYVADKPKYIPVVLDAMEGYVEQHGGLDNPDNRFTKRVCNKHEYLKSILADIAD